MVNGLCCCRIRVQSSRLAVMVYDVMVVGVVVEVKVLLKPHPSSPLQRVGGHMVTLVVMVVGVVHGAEHLGTVQVQTCDCHVGGCRGVTPTPQGLGGIGEIPPGEVPAVVVVGISLLPIRYTLLVRPLGTLSGRGGHAHNTIRWRYIHASSGMNSDLFCGGTTTVVVLIGAVVFDELGRFLQQESSCVHVIQRHDKSGATPTCLAG